MSTPWSSFRRSNQPFSLWAGSLTLLGDPAPREGDDVRVYYGRLHTLDATGSSVPPPLEDLVAVGASGYAALEWSSYAINRVNVGGVEVWKQYRAWGQDRLDAFVKGTGGPRQPQPRQAGAPLHTGAPGVRADAGARVLGGRENTHVYAAGGAAER